MIPTLQRAVAELQRQLAALRQQNRIKLYEEARRHLGIDVTPLDKVDDAVACAEVVTTLLGRVIPFPVIPGTATLHHKIKSRPDLFVEVSTPRPGDIALAPTVGKNIGHVGILGVNNIIMSNDSWTGLFRENYTVSSWIERYVSRKGLRNYWYRLK